LPGASVKIEGTSQTAEPDRTGAFQILRVPAGAQTLSISYLGFAAKRVTVEIRAGEIVVLDSALEAEIKETVNISETLELPFLFG
jgi:hypothetical protein